jgi:predicted transcriptional regulator
MSHMTIIDEMRAKILSSQWIDRIVVMANTLDYAGEKALCIRYSVRVLRHGALLPPQCDHLIFDDFRGYFFT